MTLEQLLQKLANENRFSDTKINKVGWYKGAYIVFHPFLRVWLDEFGRQYLFNKHALTDEWEEYNCNIEKPIKEFAVDVEFLIAFKNGQKSNIVYKWVRNGSESKILMYRHFNDTKWHDTRYSTEFDYATGIRPI